MINVTGLVLLVVLYVVILVLGIVAARCFKLGDGPQSELALVAGRRLGPCVGIFTMTATVVGGGYLNGTAESMLTAGLAWTIAPFGIFLGLIIGGLVYARRMRDQCYLTMLDPLQERYGPLVTVLIYLASLCGDIFWTASILVALGSSVSVVINLDVTIAIIASAAVTTCYTLIGQMVSVAFTDIAELVLIVVGLGVSLPFILTNEKTGDIVGNIDLWRGDIPTSDIASWIDFFITMIFGTIPWQSYFQRVLSVQSGRDAQILSVAAACCSLVLAFPSYTIGVVGMVSDWTNTSIGASPLQTNQSSDVLPLVINEFTPTPVALIGLTAVCAAVMSSMDSSILGSSSMFTHNIFKNIVYQKAGDRLLLWIQRSAVLVIGVVATAIALNVKSIYGLFILAADIVFVIVLPQLTCAIYLKFTNAYGALAGYILGIVLRLGAGEQLISLPAFIKYPFYDETFEVQLFPFRILAFIGAFVVIIVVSLVTNVLCMSYFPERVDVLGVVERRTKKRITVYSISKNISENSF